MPLMAEKLSSATIEKVPARQRENTSLDRATGSAYLYQELRDRHVAFFADRLSQGVWRVRYQLRAQTPGSFHALPLIGQAMYVPELRGNSEEVRVKVMD